MAKKEKIMNELLKQLAPEQKRLFRLISIENRKEKLLFRMPRGVISLEEIWVKIAQTCEAFGIEYTRADPFATLEELDELLGEVNWEWPNWLPRGFVTTLVGDPGVGKSMFALDIARIITNGDIWPMSENSANVGSVVWIETEASQQLLNLRSKALAVKRDRVFVPVIDGDILSQPDMSVDGHKEQIVNLVKAKKPSLVVLDSLGGSHSRGENKVEEMRPIMEFFALLARDCDTAVIATHHLNKAYQNDTAEISLYRMRGSTIIPAMSRIIIALEKTTDSFLRLRVIKSNLSKVPEPLSVTAEYDGNSNIKKLHYSRYIPPPSKRTKKEQCAEWVLRELEKTENGIPLRDLIDMGEGVGYTRGNIYDAKSILGDRVYTTGNGRESVWKLTNFLDKQSIQKIINCKNGKKT